MIPRKRLGSIVSTATRITTVSGVTALAPSGTRPLPLSRAWMLNYQAV